MKQDTLELTIEKPIFGGAGLARHDGQVVFVDGGLPGSTVVARITKTEKSCLHAVVQEVTTPSPHAAEPFCPHFGECGGCTWQNASYEAQLAWKREIVQEQMRRIGRIEIEVPPVIASPQTRLYRNKMEFAFGPGDGTGPVLGLHKRYEPTRILEISACYLMPEPAVAILEAVRAFARTSGLAVYSPKTQQGVWRFLVLRHSEATGDWLVQLIVGPKADLARLHPLGEALTKDFPMVKSVTLGLRSDRSEYAIAESRGWSLGSGVLEENLDSMRFKVSAESFFQTNTQAAELLAAEVVRAAALTGSEVVWDLYCGCGGLSLPLARKAGSVVGFEANRQAVADARESVALNNMENCRFVPGDLKDAVPKRKGQPDVVVVDPPRAGLHPDTLALLTRLAPARMVYVSCNPSTLARDLGRLKETYDVTTITPVDLFPHTHHVECVTTLVRR